MFVLNTLRVRRALPHCLRSRSSCFSLMMASKGRMRWGFARAKVELPLVFFYCTLFFLAGFYGSLLFSPGLSGGRLPRGRLLEVEGSVGFARDALWRDRRVSPSSATSDGCHRRCLPVVGGRGGGFRHSVSSSPHELRRCHRVRRLRLGGDHHQGDADRTHVRLSSASLSSRARSASSSPSMGSLLGIMSPSQSSAC